MPQNLNLVESFKTTARKLNRRFFWEEMVEAIMAGKVRGIDMRAHYRDPKPIKQIINLIHKQIAPGHEMTPQLFAFYCTLLKSVLDALDFRLYEHEVRELDRHNL